MSKILINEDLVNPYTIPDVGVTIPANDSYTIHPTDYATFAASDDTVIAVGASDLIVNDGSVNLGIAEGVALIQGNFPQKLKVEGEDGTLADVVTDTGGVKRFAVDMISESQPDEKLKVTGSDTVEGYLDDKLVVANGSNTTNPLEKTVLNPGLDEDLQLKFDETKVVHQNLDGAGTNTHAQIDSHIASTANPHSTTFSQAVAADPGTDITPAEAETLTDNSNADSLHKHTLDKLTDTLLTSPSSGEHLEYNGSQWVNVPSIFSDLAGVQARRTTAFTSTTSYASMTFDATDEETDTDIVEHNNTITSRIQIKETGLYYVGYNASWNFVGGATSSEINMDGRCLLNGVTAFAETASGNYYSSSGATDEECQVNYNGIRSLTAGDFVEVQYKHRAASGTPTVTSKSFPTFVIVRFKGLKGEQGLTGSGSTLTIQDEDIAVTGTPHSILNFEGDAVSVANDGGGKATVTISGGVFGSEFQKEESLGESTTTVDLTDATGTYQTKLTLTTTSLPLGDYIINWSSDFGAQDDDKVAARVRHSTTELSVVNHRMKRGNSFTRYFIPFCGHAVLTSIAGINTFTLEYAADGNGDAAMKNARLTLWRIS